MADRRTERRKIGDIGEEIACKFLRNRGFSILERNYLKKWGEIDVVAENNAGIRFIEVKTVVSREKVAMISRGKAHYRPEENVHPMKLKRISRAAQSYILDNSEHREKSWQIDVVTVTLDEGTKEARVRFLENVL